MRTSCNNICSWLGVGPTELNLPEKRVTAMIVCVCRKVSDRQILQAVAEGAHSLDCLEFELGVASQCGRCAECASQVLARAAAAHGSCTPITLHRALPQPA